MEYANRLSRLLLRRGFARQFAFPLVDNSRIARFLKLLRPVLPDRQPVPIRRPIFLLCLPRSGSTWLQELLCAHPDVGYFTHLMHHFPEAVSQACALARRLGLEARGERFIGDSVHQGLGSPSEGLALWGDWLGLDPACLDYEDLTRADIGESAAAAMRRTMGLALAEFPGRSRFFCKNPGFIPYAPLLAELFPDAVFIHLVRDPRLTANSMCKLLARCDAQLAAIKASRARLTMNLTRFIPYPRLPRLTEYVQRFGPADPRTTARLWRDAIAFLDACANRLPRLLTVRFEDVLAAPAQTVQTILDFCQLPPFAPDHAVFQALCAQTGVVAHVNQYRDYALIADICRAGMARLDYAPEPRFSMP